jgi:hypothetical protein
MELKSLRIIRFPPGFVRKPVDRARFFKARELGASLADTTDGGLFAKQRRSPVATAIGLDQPIITQDSDPGIPMATARFFAEHRRKLFGFHIGLASSG